MLKIIFTFALGVSLLVGWFVLTNRETKPANVKGSEIAGQKIVTTETHEFDPVLLNGDELKVIEKEIAVVNPTNRTLSVTKIDTSCSCVVGQLSKTKLKPGEKQPRIGCM